MHPIDLDKKVAKRHVVRVVSYFGQRWINKRLGHEEKRVPLKEIGRRSQTRHPVVVWYQGYKNWLKMDEAGGDIKHAGPALELVSFGRALEISRKMAGFRRIEPSLKDAKRFLAAAFEMEVAAFYSLKGWDVEFLEEGDLKSPDLRVAHPVSKFDFFVECKRRDSMTHRDKKNDAVWRELGGPISAELKKDKISACVEVEWLRDPVREDLELVVRSVRLAEDRINREGGDVGGQVLVTKPQVMAVKVTRISDGEWFESQGVLFSTEPHDRLLMFSDGLRTESGMTWRRPLVLAFKTAEPSDKIKGVVQSLKSAAKQLSPDKPGVVWIRIPDNSWSAEDSRDFDRGAEILQAKLKGNINTRISEVNVMTRFLRRLVDGERKGLAYSPLVKTIRHTNPKHEPPVFEERSVRAEPSA